MATYSQYFHLSKITDIREKLCGSCNLVVLHKPSQISLYGMTIELLIYSDLTFGVIIFIHNNSCDCYSQTFEDILTKLVNKIHDWNSHIHIFCMDGIRGLTHFACNELLMHYDCKIFKWRWISYPPHYMCTQAQTSLLFALQLQMSYRCSLDWNV